MKKRITVKAICLALVCVMLIAAMCGCAHQSDEDALLALYGEIKEDIYSEVYYEVYDEAYESVRQRLEEEYASKKSYDLAYQEWAYVSDEVRQTWREPLIDFLSTIHPYGHAVEVNPFAEHPEDRYQWYEGPHSVSLLDIDMDGTPEVILSSGIGTSWALTHSVYDLMTGKYIDKFSGGGTDNWCVYYNTEGGIFQIYGLCTERAGWSDGARYTSMIYMGEDEYYDIEVVLTRRLFYESYSMESVDHIKTGDGADSDYDKRLETVYEPTSYRLEWDQVGPEDYFYEYNMFWNSLVRLPYTRMITLSWNDAGHDDFKNYEFERDQPILAAQMADALLSSEQRFIIVPQADEE